MFICSVSKPNRVWKSLNNFAKNNNLRFISFDDLWDDKKAYDNKINLQCSYATQKMQLTLEESRKIVETVGNRLDPKAKIIWGAQIYKDLEKTVRTMVIITGVHSDQIFGEGNSITSGKRKAIEQELGIDFMS